MLDEIEPQLPSVECIAHVVEKLIKEDLLSHLPSLCVVIDVSFVSVLHLFVDSSEQLKGRL